MKIRKIEVSNFKSFEHIDIELSDFNVVIGANASGKSNFIKVFEFLRDIEKYGLNDAITIQGGIKFLRNIAIGSTKQLIFKITIEPIFNPITKLPKKLFGIQNKQTTYEFALEFNKKSFKYNIVDDKLTHIYNIYKFRKIKKTTDEKEEFSGYATKTYTKIKKGNAISRGFNIETPKGIKFEDIFEKGRSSGELYLPKIFHKKLLIETPFLLPDPFDVFSEAYGRIFGDISIYNFDPRLSKRAIPIPGKTMLEQDGSNLAILLENIIKNKVSRKRLSNLIRDSLGFVTDIGVKSSSDRFLIINMKEKYTGNVNIPAFLLSEGTINITAYIVALFFSLDENRVIIIEEPERNVHPSLLSKIVEYAKEASKNNQIIITTHNPHILKFINKEDLLLISRNANGFSDVTRAKDIVELENFFKNNIGLDELFTMNLLETLK